MSSDPIDPGGQNASKLPQRSKQIGQVTEGDVEERAARLIGFIFVCPPLHTTIGPALLLGLLIGYFIHPQPSGLFWGLIGGGLMAAVAAIVLPFLIGLGGGELYRPHIGLVLIFTQGLMLAWLCIGWLLDQFMAWKAYQWVAFGLGLSASFWLLSLRFMATSSPTAWPMALLPPLAQGLVLIQGLGETDELGTTILALLILPLASLGLLLVVDSPFRKALGVRGSDLMRHFIAYLGRDQRTLEGELARFATRADLQVGVVSFQRPGEPRPRLLMVVPTHHPGPLGELGGSNLPQRLAKIMEPHVEAVMVLHGASLNDHNPVNAGSVPRLAEAIIRVLPEIEIQGTVSQPFRVGQDNGCVGQRLGQATLLMSLPPPEKYDDVEPSIGREAQFIARESLSGTALFGDCHTQQSVKAPHLTLESPVATQLLGRVREVVAGLKDRTEVPFQAGYGQAGKAEIEMGLGPMGVQALILEAQGLRTAYLLFDANGVDPNARADLFSSLENEVDHLILCTGDNHYLNTIRGGHNPLGNGGQWKPLVELARQALSSAADDLAPAEAGIKLTTVTDELIFGFGNTVRMASLVNGVAAAARVTWLPLFGGASLLYWVLVTLFL